LQNKQQNKQTNKVQLVKLARRLSSMSSFKRLAGTRQIVAPQADAMRKSRIKVHGASAPLAFDRLTAVILSAANAISLHTTAQTWC